MFRDVPRRPDAVVPARILRAGQGRGRPHRRRSHRPVAARQRQFQPLAGVAEPRHARALARRHGDPRRTRARAQRRPHRRLRRPDRGRARRPDRSGLRRACDDPAERGGHRARDRRGRRSGRDLCGAQGACAARSAARTARRSATCTSRSPIRGRSARTRKPPGGARCATSRSPFTPTATSIDGLARAHVQLRDADNMTERFGALTQIVLKPNSAREHAFGRIQPALRHGAAHPRQVVRAAGADPRARDARPGAGADEPPRILDVQPEPRARADRRVHRQPHAVQSGGRRGLRAFSRRSSSALDPTNPQIAARLLTAMRSWRSLEETRRGLAEAMLRADRRAADAVAGRSRHRDPQPGLRTGERRPTLRQPCR